MRNVRQVLGLVLPVERSDAAVYHPNARSHAAAQQRPEAAGTAWSRRCLVIAAVVGIAVLANATGWDDEASKTFKLNGSVTLIDSGVEPMPPGCTGTNGYDDMGRGPTTPARLTCRPSAVATAAAGTRSTSAPRQVAEPDHDGVCCFIDGDSADLEQVAGCPHDLVEAEH